MSDSVNDKFARGRRQGIYRALMQVTLVDPAGDDLPTIAAFIGVRNGDDAHHIGYLGEDPDDVAGTLGDLYEGAVFAPGPRGRR